MGFPVGRAMRDAGGCLEGSLLCLNMSTDVRPLIYTGFWTTNPSAVSSGSPTEEFGAQLHSIPS